MDIYYLKEHMFDELNGAKEYYKQASCLKKNNPAWSKQFYDMANMEMAHAKNLYNMFVEHYNEINTDPTLEKYMRPFEESVTDAFMDKMGAVKSMQEKYDK